MAGNSNNDTRPPPPSWLNKGFIQLALRTGENDPSIVVLSCDFSMANAVGDGYLSNMYRAFAELQGRQERHLVIKCEPKEGKQAEMVRIMSAYERETKMFSETLPAMQKILEEIGVLQPLSAKCLYHGSDPVPFIVLEDLRWSGFTLANRRQGLDMNHCKLVIKSHALFHASAVALHERDPTTLEYYKKPGFNENLREHFQAFIHLSMKQLEENVKKWPGYERFSEKIALSRKTLFDRLIQESQYKEGKFNTLLHGDTWTNNFMFKYNNGTPEDVRLLDFQTSFYASPTIDLQSFITTCSQEDVRNNFDNVLKDYHGILSETLNKLKCKTTVTIDELRSDFDQHSSYGVWAACSALPFVMSENTKEINDLVKPKDEEKFLSEAKESTVYERIIKKLLLHYEKLGVL